ncbi:hypothetical protein BDR26DRAFT_896197 [Obelidium mucronatum]|nr:hypothetical protein BDR26DRAFT_896197 [Obelidium mucronatum]
MESSRSRESTAQQLELPWEHIPHQPELHSHNTHPAPEPVYYSIPASDYSYNLPNAEQFQQPHQLPFQGSVSGPKDPAPFRNYSYPPTPAKKTAANSSNSKKPQSSASNGVTKKRDPHHKPKVSISFKNIAAGITRENYVPPTSTQRHQDAQNQKSNVVVAQLQDPELTDFSGCKTVEDRKKLLMRLNLNRKLKQKILEKKGEVAAGGGTGWTEQQAAQLQLGMFQVDPQYQYQQGADLFRHESSASLGTSAITGGFGVEAAGLHSSSHFTESSNIMDSGPLKRDVEVRYVPSRILTKPKKEKKNQRAGKPEQSQEPTPISAQIESSRIDNSSSSINALAPLPPIDPNSNNSHDHLLERSQQEYNTPYSAISSSQTNFPFAGYQMLYLPLQVPSSPNDPFLSPTSNLSSPPNNLSSSSNKKRQRRNSNSTPFQLTPPSSSVSSASSIPSSSSNQHPVRQLSLGSLFHPTLQTQMSNGQLLSSLGFSFSGSSSSLFGGSLGNGGASGSGSGTTAETSPIFGVFVPAPATTAVSSSSGVLAAVEEGKEVGGLSSDAKVQSPTQLAVSPTGMSPQSFYQWAFMQQKQLQNMAIQQASGSTSEGKTSEVEGTNTPVPLSKSHSLSFLLPVAASLPVAPVPSDVQKTHGKRKRTISSAKGKERAISEEENDGEDSQHQMQFIPLQPEQIQQLQQQQEMFQKAYLQQFMDQQQHNNKRWTTWSSK